MERKLRKDTIAVFRSALKAADPVEAVMRHVRVEKNTLFAGKERYRLDRIRNIFVAGGGKAGAPMASALERMLKGRITGGIVNVKYGHTLKLRKVRLKECGHPVPDSNGVEGAREIAEMAAGCSADDLFICVVSGGASALLPFPALPVTLEEKQAVTKLLLDSGANIGEMNAVRKHISSIKGGRLAALAYPARVLALLLSDVVGDDLSVIGSGIATPDPSTFEDAWNVLERYKLVERVPASVREKLHSGRSGMIPETPKPGAPAFTRTQNLLVGSNRLALEAAEAEAKRLGYRTLILASTIEGETRDVARMHAAIAREIRTARRPVKPPACVITGGETTVTIRGKGKGGRNQEFALAAAVDIAGLEEVCILSGGTDGTDGPTDAAGGIVDSGTLARGDSLNLNARRFLADNDSYSYLKATDGLLITGPTNTNVMDVRLMLVG